MSLCQDDLFQGRPMEKWSPGSDLHGQISAARQTYQARESLRSPCLTK
jgi:hypothetical protein